MPSHLAPAIEVPHSDLEWPSFHIACTTPGLPAGQQLDRRYALDHDHSLHEHVLVGRSRFHLDAGDVCRDVLKHYVRDTRGLEGIALGALLGYFITGGFPGALLGAATGGTTGGFVPRRKLVSMTLQQAYARLGWW